MDARDYFQPPTAQKPLFIEHQCGGLAGGRIVKNRAWWHIAYQRSHISQGSTASGVVPLAQERAGVFTTQIFDPLTTRVNPAGSGSIRDPFPNNTIPAARFDKLGKNLVDRYRTPTRRAASTTTTTLSAPPAPITPPCGATSASATRTPCSRAGRSTRRLYYPAAAAARRPDRSNARRAGPQPRLRLHPPRHHRHRQRSPVRLQPRGTGAGRHPANRGLDPRRPCTHHEIRHADHQRQHLCRIGARPANFDNVPVTKDSFVYDFSDNLSSVHGRHTTKVGFDFQEIFAPTFATLDGRGSFGFTGVFTQNPQRRPGSGSSIADLLLGIPNTITVGTPSDAHERTRNYYLYVQHDWIVTSRFTLNMGLRYEITSPFWDDNGRLANLVVDAGTPLFGQYVVAGDPRVPRSLQTTDHNNFAPRFGFAWKGPKSTVLRAGFGLFYAQDEGFGVSQRPNNNPPFVGFGGYAVVSDQLNISSTIPLSQTLPARPAPPDPKTYSFDPRATVQIRSWRCATPVEPEHAERTGPQLRLGDRLCG